MTRKTRCGRIEWSESRNEFPDCGSAPGFAALNPGYDRDSHLLIRVDHCLAVGARALEPVSGQLLADLLQAGLECVAWRTDVHLVGLELAHVPGGLVLGHFP